MKHNRTEADRLRVILTTLAYADEKVTLADALPTIWKIEEKTAELEAPANHDEAGWEMILPNTEPNTVADWMDGYCTNAIEFVDDGKLINAIKEVRGTALAWQTNDAGRRVIDRLGLKEAKYAVEHWRNTRRPGSGRSYI